MRFLFNTYVAIGFVTCMWFTVAAYSGWRLPRPDIKFSSGSSGSSGFYSPGRTFGGSWGGGK